MELQFADVCAFTDGSYSSKYVPFVQVASPRTNFSYDCRGLQTVSSALTLDHSDVYPSWETQSVLSQIIVLAVVGVVGGAAMAGAHGLLEVFLHQLFEFLHRRGKIQRLAPSIPVTMNHFRMEDFWAVAVWQGPLLAFVYHNREVYMEKMKFSGDIVSCWLAAVTVMVLHDAYFYAVHTVMHKCKALYRRVHSWHHSTRGDLTVFCTAFGDLLDVALTFGPFYFGVVYYDCRSSSRDPLAWFMLLWAVNGVDMMGHCGYDLPAWIYVPGSMGVLLTPLAQRSRHHYIHHLDPRFNRSLYFTWWDRLGGTFRQNHPKIDKHV